MPSARSSVSVFALSVSWLWNTQMKCGFLASISWEHVHSPAREKPVKNIDLDRASASQTAAWRAKRLTSVSECMRVFVGRLDSFLKERLTAYGCFQQCLMPARFISHSVLCAVAFIKYLAYNFPKEHIEITWKIRSALKTALKWKCIKSWFSLKKKEYKEYNILFITTQQVQFFYIYISPSNCINYKQHTLYTLNKLLCHH